jgi:hypothetical protein
MTKLAENNPQGTANITDDRMLATAALSGCEIVKCKHYKDGKCNDPNEYVNKQGENVCGRKEDAILYEDYLEMIRDNQPMMSFDRPAEF